MFLEPELRTEGKNRNQQEMEPTHYTSMYYYI